MSLVALACVVASCGTGHSTEAGAPVGLQPVESSSTTAPNQPNTSTPEPSPQPDPPVSDPPWADDAVVELLGEFEVVDLAPVAGLDRPPTPGTIRLWTYGGYTVGVSDVTYVFEPDGDVLEITEGNIYSGPSSYTTWNVGPDGYKQLVDSLGRFAGHRNPVFEPGKGTGRNLALNASHGGLDLSVSGLDADPSLMSTEEAKMRRDLRKLLNRFGDMSWLDSDVTEPRPWVPTHLSLTVRAERDTRYYITEDVVWPFEDSVAQMALGPIDPESVVCLEGPDAAVAWDALLFDGVNNARMPVIDDERAYEIGLAITYPGYQTYGDPCPGVTELVPTESAPPDGTLDALLFDEDDVEPAWELSAARNIYPPPVLEPCPEAGPATEAVRTFDSTMRRYIELNRPGTSLTQIVGEAETRNDIDSIVDLIAPFDDCSEPFSTYGITEFDSGDLEDLPVGVSSGAFWTFRTPSGYVAVADIALESRFTMVISLESRESPIDAADLDPWIELAAAELSEVG